MAIGLMEASHNLYNKRWGPGVANLYDLVTQIKGLSAPPWDTAFRMADGIIGAIWEDDPIANKARQVLSMMSYSRWAENAVDSVTTVIESVITKDVSKLERLVERMRARGLSPYVDASESMVDLVDEVARLDFQDVENLFVMATCDAVEVTVGDLCSYARELSARTNAW